MPHSYVRPPITEAVIGIEFVIPLNEEVLADVQTRMAKDYQQSKKLGQVRFNVEVQVSTKQTTAPEVHTKIDPGYRLSSSQLSELAILKINGLTVSQLAPYPGWVDFFDRFKRDWKNWKKAAGFREIKRVGVRYINRIDIPVENVPNAPIIEESHFLEIYPKVPAALGPIDAYAMQISRKLPDLDCDVVINSAVVPSPLPDHLSIVLDQDISSSRSPPQSDEALFSLLEKVRERKNLIFEMCVTDGARELFDK